jgi:hypothetical protein
MAGAFPIREVRVMLRRMARPSPAMVVALIALFVALSGTAVAAGIVPLAKRALSADNAKKLQGFTAARIAAAGAVAGSHLPGPASTASNLVAVQAGTFSLAAGTATSSPNATFSVACPSGAKAISGGYSSNFNVQGADSAISSDGSTFSVLLVNFDTNAATGVTYAVCLK